MKVREIGGMGEDDGFTPQYTADSIRELEEMHARGEIEPHAYLLKKRALVKLYLKSTTNPKRRRRPYEDDF